ncbi:hypothetical protein Nmel_014577, partial [Mimus melanotis]
MMICPAMDTKVTTPILCSSMPCPVLPARNTLLLWFLPHCLYLQSLWGFAPYDSKDQNVEQNWFARCDCWRALGHSGMGAIMQREGKG